METGRTDRRKLLSYVSLPSAEHLLSSDGGGRLICDFGRVAVTEGIREVLGDLRSRMGASGASGAVTDDSIMEQVCSRLREQAEPSLRPVFNLTGTVLHTNLGRANLPDEAIEAIALAARTSSNLEYDLTKGRRGDRDDHVERMLCRLTGAEAATVVNNNAAAVLLLLKTRVPQGGAHIPRGID